MNTLGKPTKSTFLATENGKISLEFEVASGQTLKRGQPVKLTAAGKVTAWAKADLEHTLIGYLYNDGAATELVTVLTRGYALIHAISSAACSAGPACYQGYDSSTDIGGTTGYSTYDDAADATETHAWNLVQAAGANELLRVLVRD